MMGTKARIFGPITNVSLEDLVPKDHFYRHVERKLDLSFVRDLVRDLLCSLADDPPSIPSSFSSSSWSCSLRASAPSANS